MRRISILSTSLFTSFVMILTALAASPANANTLANGTYLCSTGAPTAATTNIYTITTVGSVVTLSDAGTCTGDVVIPEGVNAIPQYAFGGSQVTSVSLPASINQISSLAPFYGTGALTAINVASTNAAFTSVAGVLFGLDGASATLIAYPANKVGSTYTTPTSVSFAGGSLKTVTTIAYYAFQASKNLTTLNISEGVTTIMSGIAESATLLSSINLPNSYTVMTAKPFSGAAITSLTISKFLTSIDAGAFNQTNLNSISVATDNPNYSSLDGVLFDKDKLKLHSYPMGKSLSNYVVPETVTHIESSAFNSSKVNSVSIPNGVSTMGEGVFESATALTSITVATDNSNFSAIDGVLFNKPPKKLIAYPLGKAANSYLIPSGVEIIGSGAFMSASNLTSVTIPSSVSTLEGSAFFCATSLTRVYFFGNAPAAVGNQALTCLGAEPKAFVTAGAIASFGGLGSNWNGLTVEVFDPPVTNPAPNVVSSTLPSAVSKTISIKLPTFYASPSKLNKSQKTYLKNLVNKSGTKATFVVTASAGKLPGVTDMQVKALAKKRGQVVIAYLVKLGVSESQIRIKVKITNQGIVPKTKILTHYLTS
jgi:hypothetical protein